LTVK
jgi:WD40 repeat protein